MALESGVTYIDDLVATNPVGATDNVDEGDDHIRNIKTAVQGSFPSLGNAAVTKTAAEINDLVEKTDPVLNGTITGTAFLDQDDLSDDSDIAVASQQSIKAYVDTEVAAVPVLTMLSAPQLMSTRTAVVGNTAQGRTILDTENATIAIIRVQLTLATVATNSELAFWASDADQTMTDDKFRQSWVQASTDGQATKKTVNEFGVGLDGNNDFWYRISASNSSSLEVKIHLVGYYA